MNEKMDIFGQIDSLVKDTKELIRQKKRRKLINIYAEGLKKKLWEANFAIKKLKELRNQSDAYQTSTSKEEEITDQIYFYSDAFWAFLYASLDVLGQLVNQILKLNLSEGKTDFKQVDNK